MSKQRQSLLNSMRRAIGLGKGAGLSDADLLDRFVSQRDEAAFEVLVWRHAGLVFSACRRVLRHAQDVEDAFQATFLVLLRKSDSIRRPELLGSWLYQVAYRLALRARTTAARRALLEKPSGDEPEPCYDPPSPDLRSMLDEELNHLPEKYRTPLVLCYLEGMTKEEAADRLGCPAGTVSSRLTRGRERLRTRLARRGMALTTAAVVLAMEKSSAFTMPPPHLVESTLRAVLLTGTGGSQVAAGLSMEAITLAKDALRAMLTAKLKMVTCCALTLAAMGGGTGLFIHRMAAAPAPQISEAATMLLPPAEPERPTADQPEERAADEARSAAKASASFPLAAGRSWEVAPRTMKAGKADLTGFFTSDTVLAIYNKDSRGGLVITLSYPLRNGRETLSKYRPVAFDSDRGRHPFQEQWTAHNKDIASYQYRLDPSMVPLDEITHVGIEKAK
jgi:RNA polymerase sigma factor (sigma-70 family)